MCYQRKWKWNIGLGNQEARLVRYHRERMFSEKYLKQVPGVLIMELLCVFRVIHGRDSTFKGAR